MGCGKTTRGPKRGSDETISRRAGGRRAYHSLRNRPDLLARNHAHPFTSPLQFFSTISLCDAAVKRRKAAQRLPVARKAEPHKGLDTGGAHIGDLPEVLSL